MLTAHAAYATSQHHEHEASKTLWKKQYSSTRVLSPKKRDQAFHPRPHKKSISQGADLKNTLNWIPHDPLLCHPCTGCYANTSIPSPHSTSTPGYVTTTISAKHVQVFAQEGRAVFKTSVHVIDAHRILDADRATVYYDKKTWQIKKIMLVGHIRLREQGRLMAANILTLTLKPKHTELWHAAYHLAVHDTHHTSFQHVSDIWGTAHAIIYDQFDITELQQATYSTCALDHPTWWLSVKKLVLDTKHQVGTAYHGILWVKGVPVFYWPYYSFSLNHQRKSGFLFPRFGIDNQTGAVISLPIYWNIAPNYDLTSALQYLTRRGIRLVETFRFLSTTQVGSVYLSYIPHDRTFKQFQQEMQTTFSNAAIYDQSIYQPLLEQLERESQARAFFSFRDTLHFNPNWSSHIQINRVSDPYYFQNFGGARGASTLSNQLLNQVDLRYRGVHWNFFGLVQDYQTLHMVNQTENPPLDQYIRAPDLNANAYYPDLLPAIDFYWRGELVNFNYHSVVTSEQRPTGQRLNLHPGIRWPVYFASGSITPEIALDLTTYQIAHPTPVQSRQPSRLLPIFNVDIQQYFDHRFHMGSHDFTQTLEPHIFYLFIPYRSQTALPNFDTVLLPWNFERLFWINQFTGDDRLQNANQVSMGLTSRILNTASGTPILTGRFGLSYYISRPRVSLSDSNPPSPFHWSPLLAELTYYTPLIPWSLNGSLAWDPNRGQTNNSSIQITYNDTHHRVLSLGYLFVHENGQSIVDPNTLNTAPTNPFSTNTSLLLLQGLWPMTERWSAVGSMAYNFNRERIDTLFSGVQYDSCCWSFRLVVQHSFASISSTGPRLFKNRFNTGFYFQLELKGLATVGTRHFTELFSTMAGMHS